MKKLLSPPFSLQYFQFLAVQHQGTRNLKMKHHKAFSQR